jgi:hypothetical protein
VSATGLGLNYLTEARAVIDAYYENQYLDDEAENKRTSNRMLVETVACALVSIAESLHRIVDDVEQESRQ